MSSPTLIPKDPRHHQSTQAFTTREDRMPNHNMLIRKARGYQCWVSLGDPGRTMGNPGETPESGAVLVDDSVACMDHGYYPLVNEQIAIENGNFPWKIVIFHSYVNVYQRVSLSKWDDHEVEWKMEVKQVSKLPNLERKINLGWTNIAEIFRKLHRNQ